MVITLTVTFIALVVNIRSLAAEMLLCKVKDFLGVLSSISHFISIIETNEPVRLATSISALVKVVYSD